MLKHAAREAAARAPDDAPIPTARRPRCRTASAAGRCSTPADAPTAAATCADGLPDRRDHAWSRRLGVDLGRCLFCADCAAGLPDGRHRPTAATTAWPPRTRDDLRRAPSTETVRLAARARREDAAALRPLAQAAPGQRRRLQRLRGRRQRARHRRLRPRPLRHPVRRLAAPRRRPAGHRPGHREHAPGPAEDLRRGRRRRRSSSPSAPAPSPAARTSTTPRCTTAPTRSCPSISSSPAARRTRSPSSTACCGCWGGWKPKEENGDHRESQRIQ